MSKNVLYCGDCARVLGRHVRCGHPDHEHVLVEIEEGNKDWNTPTGQQTLPEELLPKAK